MVDTCCFNERGEYLPVVDEDAGCHDLVQVL